MKPAPIPNNESERLHLLHDLDILDTEPEPVFDNITQFAKQLFDVDAALITLVDSERQWFKSKIGFQECETPREVSFCGHAIMQGTTMVVEDATKDDRFYDNPFVVAAEGVRFYAGAPLEIKPGIIIGTLCLIDSKPRQFSLQQRQWLERLAEWVKNELTNRYAISNYEQERQVLAEGPIAAVVWQVEPEAHLIYAAANVEKVLGYSRDHLLSPAVNYESIVHRADRAQLLARMQAVLDGEQPTLELEYRVITPENELRWVQHYARADYDSQGHIVRVRGYLHDNTKRKQLELSLQQANQSFALALAAGNLATWDWNLFTQTVSVNHTWAEILGRDESYARQNQWAKLIHPDDFPATRTALQRHLKGLDERFEARFRMQHADGHFIWLHSIGKVIESDEQGLAVRMVGIHHDITEEVVNDQRRRQQETILSLVTAVQHEFLFVKEFSEVCDIALPQLMALTHSDVGIIGELPGNSYTHDLLWLHGVRRYDDDSKNRAYQKLIQQGLEVEVTGRVIRQVLSDGEAQLCPYPVQKDEMLLQPIDLPEFDNAYLLPLFFNREVVGILLLANAKGGYNQELLTILEPMLNTLGTLMHFRRIEEQRLSATDELRRMATIDELTQVANRRIFLETAGQKFNEQHRYDVPVSVAIIDLDHFKNVNDTYGHAAGDKVLKYFADITRETLRDGDLLGRQGGEEFAILLPHADIEQAMLVAERVRRSVENAHFEWQGKRIPITVSIGIAQLLPTDKDIDRWFARADKALYQAKSDGRNRCIAANEV